VRRVALIVDDLAPGTGGVASAARDLVRGLLERGVAVRVYAARGFGPEPLDVPAAVVRRVLTPAGDPWADLLIVLAALAAEPPDVVHLMGAARAAWVPALVACVARAVVTGDALGAERVDAASEGEARAIRAAGLCASDTVFVPSAFAGSRAAAAGAPSARIELLRDGVDTSRFAPASTARGDVARDDAALAARLGIRRDDEVILATSRLTPFKRHALALEALARILPSHPRALFAYTGDDPLLRAAISARAMDLGVRERVRPVGLVAEADLPALYRIARAVVALSDETAAEAEGLGLPLLEAAASGVPVVASRTGGMPEAVLDGVTGIVVPPGDAGAIADAIARLLEDPVRARRMGERGRARALGQLSARSRVARLLDRWSALRDAGLDRAARDRGLLALGEILRREDAASPTGAPTGERARTPRTAVARAADPADLLHRASTFAAAKERGASRRRASFAEIVAQGGVVRIRARESGEGLLAEALADCAALGSPPLVEGRLDAFVAPDFQARALPRIRGVFLEHRVPSPRADAVIAGLFASPPEAMAKVREVRVVATRGVSSAAVREAQAIRRVLERAGAPVALSPELEQRIREDHGPRARDVSSYEDTLCTDRAPEPWVPRTLEQAITDQVAVEEASASTKKRGPPVVVDFGCGVAVALLGVTAIASRRGVAVDARGFDRGFEGLFEGDPFPADEPRMRRILARHSARIGEVGASRLPVVQRCDLELAWPLPRDSVALAVSRTAVMYLADKLSFLEHVYASLRAGGVALIHLDHLRAGSRELTRVRLPGATLDDVLAEQRARGVEIHAQGDLVIAMRKTRARLHFPWTLERAHPMTEILGGEEPWGMVSHYRPRGAPPPDGKYRNVRVEGRVVPMIVVKERGAVVLVDTVGQEPRRWREQFKRRADLPPGMFDLHRSNAAGGDSFAEHAIDRRGLWIMDAAGNIEVH
jgi:phosphatidylinositol alpha-1,6-mannosyltransferase